MFNILDLAEVAQSVEQGTENPLFCKYLSAGLDFLVNEGISETAAATIGGIGPRKVVCNINKLFVIYQGKYRGADI